MFEMVAILIITVFIIAGFTASLLILITVKCILQLRGKDGQNMENNEKETRLIACDSKEEKEIQLAWEKMKNE